MCKSVFVGFLADFVQLTLEKQQVNVKNVKLNHESMLDARLLNVHLKKGESLM